MTSGDTPEFGTAVGPGTLPPPTPAAAPWPGPPVYGGPYPAPSQPLAYPYPGPWIAAPAPPPRRLGQPWWQRLVNLLAVLVILGAGGALVGLPRAVVGAGATWVKGPAQLAGPPGEHDSDATWTSWARSVVATSLDQQGKALIAGDESGFLANADPDNASLLADLTHRYQTLHAMGPGVWAESLSGTLTPTGSRRWSATVRTAYCFGPPSCTSADLMATSEWGVKGDRLILTKLDPTGAKFNGPRPWETGALTVRTAGRVVMAAPKSSAWRLPDAVISADKAAKVADTFARWEPAPSKYVIFFAGQTESNTWYGDEQPNWAAAWTVPVSSVVSEVVVRDRAVRQADLEFLLTHELTHVTSLAGKRDGAGPATWWLIEGLADYAAMLKIKISRYDGIVPTRSFVRHGWDGSPAVAAPAGRASDAEAAARYGIAFLAVRAISHTYGQDKMLNFFGRVVHDAAPLDGAARETLGASWVTVAQQCDTFIRSAIA